MSSSSFTVQCSLPPSRALHHPDQSPSTKAANFAQIPSWVSRKSTATSIDTCQFELGQVENVHLVSLSKQGKLREAIESAISAYAQKGVLNRAILMFSKTIESGIRPNASSFTSPLSSLTEEPLLELGRQIHSYVIRSEMSSNVSVETAIANMYVKCGWLEGARNVFDRMEERNAVVWTALMVGYTEDDKLSEILELFAEMVKKSVEVDDFVFSIVLEACAGLEDLNMGRQVHSYSVKLGLDSEVSVGTPLVDFYVKCAKFESACRAFKGIHEPNDVSWSAIISGYCQSGKFDKCVKIFQSLITKGVTLNSFVLTSILQACSAIADINLGTQVHADFHTR